jgi:hypothetical protein
MNAHKVETVLSEDGTLTLQGLPFHIGDAVEVIILERSRSVSERESPSISFRESPSQLEKAVLDESEPNSYPLRGTVLHYEDPFEPAVPIEDWEALQ